MRTNILITLNVILAISLFVFVLNMLPFAHGVACDAQANTGNACEPLSTFKLILRSLIPPLFVLVTAFIARWVKETKPQTSSFLFLLWPVLTLSGVITAWSFSLAT